METLDVKAGSQEIERPIDLEATLESAQTFCWRRTGDDPLEYTTVVDGEGVHVTDAGAGVRYETTGLDEDRVRSLLGLDYDVGTVHAEVTHDERVAEAVDRYGDMRVVDDPFFRCLVSFIVSANNHVSRIYGLVQDLCREYGEPVDGYGYGFPSPEALAAAGEAELRDLGLGYRAPYVVESARMVASGEFDHVRVQGLEYEEAHEEIKRLVGVGPKVGDCVLLFSLGFDEAVPFDTWMQRTVEEYYPELVGSNYRETSRRFRDRFGCYAGHAQNYLFHYVRMQEDTG